MITTLERSSAWGDRPTLAMTAHAARDLAVTQATDAINDWAVLMLVEQVEHHCAEYDDATANMNPEDEDILDPLYEKATRLAAEAADHPRDSRHGAIASLASTLDAAARYAERHGYSL